MEWQSVLLEIAAFSEDSWKETPHMQINNNVMVNIDQGLYGILPQT